MCFKRKIGLFICCFIVVLTCEAQPNTTIKEFTIKPGLCIVEAGKPCRQSFIFFWRLSDSFKACVFQSNKNAPLHCEQKKEVEVTLFMDLKRSDQFILHVNDNQIRQDILVRQLTQDIRHMRRHVWSVF